MMSRSNDLARRRFLQAAGTGLMLSAVGSNSLQAQRSERPVRVGLVGCGGRANAVVGALIQDAGAHLVALADLFEDKVKLAKERFDEVLKKKGADPIAVSRLYKGHEAYKRLIDSDLDAVVFAATPYYYPELVPYAVAAGKHIYCEKPVATDVAGCLRFMEAGKKAEGKITFHVGLQVRSIPAMREMVARIHSGAIGEIVTAQSYFYWPGGNIVAPAGAGRDEARIRSWWGDRTLSGDIMVEQNVHSIDKLNWILRGHPISAVASGGRKARRDFGNVWDHFVATLYYPNDVRVSFNSTQFLKGWSDVCERFFGTKGVSESHYVGGIKILGENPWDSGVESIFPGIDSHKTREFVNEIQTGKYRNESAFGAESTLSAILVRTAAYQGREVAWEDLINSNEKWDPQIDLKQFV